ncbi:MAG: hypothetical protein IPI33_09995 [Dehalococcoidia bacterium]|nr:hypothetical protein [Dehalococcoidia bacterium]
MFFEREVGFYRDIGYAVGVRTPKPYYALFEPAEADFALVLEDVTRSGPAASLFDRAGEARGPELHGKWWQSAQLTKMLEDAFERSRSLPSGRRLARPTAGGLKVPDGRRPLTLSTST